MRNIHEEQKFMINMFSLMHMDEFVYKEVLKSVKKLHNGKAVDILHIGLEMLKWTGPMVKE